MHIAAPRQLMLASLYAQPGIPAPGAAPRASCSQKRPPRPVALRAPKRAQGAALPAGGTSGLGHNVDIFA